MWREEAEERPVLLTHFIKLYPSNAPASADPSTYMTTTVPVVSERYDEVVFTNPKVVFHKQLLDGQQVQQQTKNKKRKKNKQLAYPLSHEASVIEHFRTYGDEMDVKAMLAAREFLQKELRTVKDRLIKVDEELEEVKDRLAAAVSESSTAASATAAATTTASTTTKVASGSAGTKGSTTSSAATSGKGGSTTSLSKSSKKKKTTAEKKTTAGGGASGEPASKKAKSS